ncbi:MarR family transcriptional regulator [Actinorhabdospora filicis]|uniref:MarR family transcriptional regulator n=1 Tax=Actinorhabdospora filicis TaxID=1785913 RepID=A0A9W6W2F5_9ACTN|nr:MarR family winged helix-turn-helix transcriptional regulator [Actinorhabdospora filicis]GLZ76957.1 MarR family transcriptional regulator [Actinorhabdospora filicis]
MSVNPAEQVARAMTGIRRSQRRRALLARNAPGDPAAAHFDVLDAIESAHEKGEHVGVREIALALDVDQPRASKLVSAAVEAGHVRREADQSDGRRTLLKHTETGREVIARATAAREAAMDRAMTGWSEAERAEFARLLTRFVAGFER